MSSGVRLNSPKLLLYLTRIPEKSLTRVAFSVSKKVCPKAVDRNRYRRIGYESISRVINNIKPGYFLFFTYKKGSVPTSLSVVDKEIKALLSDSSVLE